MYRHILAAVNEYTNSEVAAHYAVALASSCRAKLTLMFVSEEGASPSVIRKADSALQRIFIEAGAHGVEAEVVIERGDPIKKIAGHAAGHGVDIVFAATRRQDVARPLFVKTVARGLMLKLPCSTALVRVVRMEKASPKKLLVPLRGGRAFEEERAYFTARLALGFGSHVTVFHLPEPVTGFFHGEARLRPAERDEAVPKDIHEFLEALDRQGVPHEKRTACGSVARGITAEAALRRSDLIVMGASRRSLLKSLAKRNPVEEVLRETPCNLIIFKPKLTG